MRSALLLVIAVGCASPSSSPNTDDVLPLVADENGCHGTADLDGMASLEGTDGGSAEFGPFAFGHGRFCLRLDASENRRAHFMAGSTRFDGEAAPLTFQLQRADGTVLVDGGDVVINRNPPHRVFASLEMPVESGSVEDVVLVVDGDATSSVGVSLFDPLE